jgi:putative endonuclease
MYLNRKIFTVYITTNYTRTVLYTGVTNNLEQRITEHYLDQSEGKTFAGKYKAYYLIYLETYDYILNAIAREKEIKGWRRQKKLDLIYSYNKDLRFLNEEVSGFWPPQDFKHRKESE